MDSGKSTDSTVMGGGVVNYFPLIVIGGVVAFIIGATVLCCATGTGPQRNIKSADTLERDLNSEFSSKNEEKKSSTKKSKAEKKNKKGKKKEPTEAELDKSINTLSKYQNGYLSPSTE